MLAGVLSTNGRDRVGVGARDGEIVEADAPVGLGGGAGPENVEGVEVESQPADVALALIDRPRHRAGVRRRRGETGVLEERHKFFLSIRAKFPSKFKMDSF